MNFDSIRNGISIQKDYLSLENTRALRFILAMMVLLFHSGHFFDFEGMWYIGNFAVAMFFSLSGYGLYTSLSTKEDYLKTFLSKRLPTLLVPWWICGIVIAMMRLAMDGSFVFDRFTDDLLYFFFGPMQWFVTELLVFYLIFYVGFLMVRNRDIALLVVTFGVIVSALAMFAWFDNGAYFSTFAGFIIGLWFAKLKDRVEALGPLALLGLFMIAVVLFIVPSFGELTFNTEGAYFMTFRMLAFVVMVVVSLMFRWILSVVTLLFSVALVLLFPEIYTETLLILAISMVLLKIPMLQSTLRFGGDFAYEIFLMHWACFECVQHWLPEIGTLESVLVSIAITLPLSYLLRLVSRAIMTRYLEAYENVSAVS